MLLGHRIRQKSILWPLVAVMLPGWLVLVSLVRRPTADLHTQLALRARVEQQMRAYDDQEAGRGQRSAEIENIYRQAHQAGLVKDPQLVDEAVVRLRLGDSDQASKALAAIEDPKKAGPYLALAQKTALNQPWSMEDRQELLTLLGKFPGDWWLTTLAHSQQMVLPATSQNKWSWWRLHIAELLLPALGILALILALPAFKILRGTWTIWPYSERLQRLWPLALMLCVLSLRGLFMLLGTSVARIVVPLISWAGQRDPMTVFHIQNSLGFVFSMVVLVATTYGVKECVASHWGSLGDVLGFERDEFRNRRFWCVAFPCAVALVGALQPLPMLLDQWHMGGASIYDSLSRSPGGYNGLGTVLSVLQAVLLAPFFEEVIYRGFLLSALRNYFGPFLGILLSSIIFALAHGSSLPGTIAAFVYGAAYASIKLHTGRISVAILVHACVGAIQMTLLLLQGG